MPDELVPGFTVHLHAPLRDLGQWPMTCANLVWEMGPLAPDARCAAILQLDLGRQYYIASNTCY